MRIGVDVSRALRSLQTGTERYALEITRHLLQLPQAAEHEWLLYTNSTPAANPFPDRTPGAAKANVYLSVLTGRRLWTHRTLAAELLANPPDVLFVPAHVIPFVLPPARLPPSVVTIHDLGYHYFPDAHTWQQRAYLQWSTRWSTRVAARVIAVSQATADDLQKIYGTDRRKIDVIYEAAVPDQGTSLGSGSGTGPDIAPAVVPGTEPDIASAVVPGAIPATAPPPGNAPLPASALRATHDVTGLPRPYALYVGTIQPRKNLLRLAQAYAELVKTHAVEWDLVLAGGLGWKSEPVVNAIDALGLEGRIHRLGYVPESERGALLRGARFFCYVSLYEGFGLPVLEAQSAGVPVMTANNSSLPEVAGDAAILVDPTDVDAIADAMLRLSSDEALRQRLIAAGHANVVRFSWTKAARATLAVLLRAAESRRP